MSKEKQIEEMAKVLDAARINALATIGSLNDGFGMWYARAMYDAGYRRQRVGEWRIVAESYRMITDDYDEELFVVCPFCNRRFWVPYELDDEKTFEYAREHYPFCNCGAKMECGE